MSIMKKQVASNALKDTILTLRANPAKTQQYMLNLMEALTNGEVIQMDATNPAILCMESAVVLSSAVMADNEAKLRRQYASLAHTTEELYLHMSDVDYLGVFSTPATVNIRVMFDLEEIMQKAVSETGGMGIRKITIPRYTRVTVANNVLSLLYPVDIKIMPHGGVMVTFDVTEKTPLAKADSNVLDWFVEIIDGVRYLNINLPMYQVNINRYTASVNASSGFTREYSFSGKYCYCRAYIRKGNGWTEIKTTHSDLVYNKDIPTLVLKVLNNALKVTIPHIYFNNGLINDSVRIDIYTTNGELDINLSNYLTNAYLHDWSPLDGENITIFSAPLKTMSTVAFYSSDTISGGSAGINFNELKHIVTSRNTVYEGLPISEKQLTRGVKDLGYSLVKNIDNITDRQYLATRKLPTPSDGFIASSLGITVGMIETDIQSLKELDSTTHSTYRLTIKPSTLYEYKDGKVEIVDSSKTLDLRNKVVNDVHYLANELNAKKYLFTPWYYVLDTKDNEIAARIYDLNNPKIRSRYFYQDNPTVGIAMGMRDYTIANSPNNDGYLLEVRLEAGQTVKDLGPDYVYTQLSYLSRDGKSRYHIQGKLVSPINPVTGKPQDDDYIYRFKIETRYDVDEDDGLIPIPYRSPVNLVHEFDIVTIIKDYNPDNRVIKTDIDTIIKMDEFENYNSASTYFGVSQSKVTIEFGKRLDKLWHKTRTITDLRQIDYWESDVPAVYEEDVYKMDSNGNIAISYDANNNNIKTTLLHRRGDLVLDPTGEQVYKHKKGDPKLDAHGNPIYKNNGDGLLRQIDFVFMDALFDLANTKAVKNYKEHCVKLVTQWASTDMMKIHNQLLDRSEVFFYPSSTIGLSNVIADENIKTDIESNQSIKVTCFVSEIDIRNNSLRDSLSKTITETIQSVISRKTVSKDAILQRLRQVIGNSVVTFVVEGFVKEKYRTITLLDETMNLSLGVVAEVLPNNQIDLKNDIKIEFLVHNP